VEWGRKKPVILFYPFQPFKENKEAIAKKIAMVFLFYS